MTVQRQYTFQKMLLLHGSRFPSHTARKGEKMNHEKIPDPTADQAIAKADRQRRLEEKHRVRVGETIYITETTMEGEHGRKTVRKIKVKVAGVYEHHIRLLFPSGYYECYTWWAFRQMRG